jgi:hypothetical protein
LWRHFNLDGSCQLQRYIALSLGFGSDAVLFEARQSPQIAAFLRLCASALQWLIAWFSQVGVQSPRGLSPGLRVEVAAVAPSAVNCSSQLRASGLLKQLVQLCTNII